MRKNILMIGGSKGIGFAVAKLLSQEHTLYIASRDRGDLGEVAHHIPFDVTTDDLDPTSLPNELHGVIYLPGSINLKPFKMLDTDTFYKDMELNFFGLVKVIKAIIHKMAEGASMVFFSSVAVKIGMPFHTSVAASKGAIEGFAKSLAAEYAPKIRVNVIAPSLTDTPLASRFLSNDKKRELMANRHPLKKIGSPLDMANIAVFLLSDDSAWMSGQVIGVDGGLSTLNVT